MKRIRLPYVESIKSNLKSFDGDWELNLGERTLLVGSNTSHKSAVIQSVELALSGAADDVVGRNDVRDGGLLITLAPGKELHCSAKLSDDDLTIHYTLKRSGKTVKKPEHDVGRDLSRALPHRLVRAALAGSPATARKSFLHWAATGTTPAAVLTHLPSKHHARYKDIGEKIARDVTPVSRLLAVTEYAGKRQRECSREAKGAQVIVQSSGDMLQGAPPTDEVFSFAQQGVDEATTALQASASAPDMDANTAEVKYREAQDQFTYFSERAKELHEMIDGLERVARIADRQAESIQWVLDAGVEQCPTCSSPVGGQHLQLCLSHWETKRDQAVAEVETTSKKLHADVEDCEQRAWKWSIEVNRLEAIRVEIATRAHATNYGLSREKAQQQLTEAQERLMQLVAIRARWDDLVRARDTAAQMQEDAERYKALKDACESAVGSLLDGCTKAFVAKVRKFLPKGWKFDIELRDGNKEVFRMGLRRGQTLHCALSGAEWSAVVTAIAMATVDEEANEPVVLIPEDRAWDAKTLGQVMRAFSKFPGQVIMASTVAPDGRKPTGWTIIDMDEADRTSATPPGGEPDVDIEDEDMPSTNDIGPSLPPPPAPLVTFVPAEEDAGPINGPLSPGSLTLRAGEVLVGMGYKTEEVKVMSSKTGADLIRQGLLPHQVSIQKNGGYRVLKTDNVVPMPPPQP